MFGKNNKEMNHKQNATKIKYYGIRKFTAGVASVAIATGLLLATGEQVVSAESENGEPAISVRAEEESNEKQLKEEIKKLTDLIEEAKKLEIDTTEPETMLAEDDMTLNDLVAAQKNLQTKIQAKNEENKKLHDELVENLKALIEEAKKLGIDTSESEAVLTSGDSSLNDIITAQEDLKKVVEKEKENTTFETVNINFKTSQKNKYPNYDPELNGKVVPFYLSFQMKGKNADGGIVTFKTPFKPYNITFGEQNKVNIRSDKVKDENGNEYFDAKIINCFIDNTKGDLNFNKQGSNVSENDEEKTFMFNQNMSTKVKFAIAENAIVLDKDTKDLNIRFNVKSFDKSGKEVEPFVKSRRGGKIQAETTFSPNSVIDLINIASDIKRTDPTTTNTFRTGVDDDKLDLFSNFTGKYRKYELLASFIKPELNQYYELTVTGDDLSGWTITLSSKLEKKEIVRKESIEYETEYKENPDLPKGRERVVTEGENGEKEFTDIQYVIGETGDVVETIEDTEGVVTKEPRNEVIERGTKVEKEYKLEAKEVDEEGHTIASLKEPQEFGSLSELSDAQKQLMKEIEDESYELVDTVVSEDGKTTTLLFKKVVHQQSAQINVIDQDGKPVSGITVTTENGETAETDNRGVAWFHNLTAGKDYSFKLIYNGKEQEKTVTINKDYVSNVTFNVEVVHLTPLEPATPIEPEQPGTPGEGEEETDKPEVNKELEEKIKELEERIDKLEAEHKGLKDEIAALKKEVADLKEQLADANAKIDELEKEIEKCKQKVDACENEVEEETKEEKVDAKEEAEKAEEAKKAKDKLPNAGATSTLGAAAAYLVSGLGIAGAAFRRKEDK